MTVTHSPVSSNRLASPRRASCKYWLSYFAEEQHLSANYFGDLVKKDSGISAQEYIQAKIIEVAKGKIFDPDKSVSEIAYEMGFKHPQHFSRMFKKKTGLAPSEYRNLKW